MDFVVSLNQELKIVVVSNMGCCSHCCKPIIPILEYELNGSIELPTDKKIKIPIEPQMDIKLLKDKVICEYLSVLSSLERGLKPSLEFILEEISAIELEQELDNRECVIQYYLNNEQ